LGSVEALVDGQPISLRGLRARTVLAMLAVEADHVVPIDRLVDAIWDDDPPATARTQVQICVSALRRTLARSGRTGDIETQPPGYLLTGAGVTIDARRFDELVRTARSAAAEGRLADAVDALTAGLALWRGAPLAGLTGRAVEAHVVRLNERRMAAAEERIRLEFSLGRHIEVIGELQALIADNPLRERFYAYLMSALQGAGRSADALDVYDRARTIFVEELGIEPGTELRELQSAILSGHSAPGLSRAGDLPRHAVAAPPRQLPASVADFTGRGALLHRIRELALSDGAANAAASAARIVALSGAGGVGKSVLALHAAHSIAEHFPDGQLYVDLRGGRAAPDEVRARLLRALEPPGTAMPTHPDRLAERYADRIGDRRMLIMLDDAAEESQVTPLVPGNSGCVVLVTSRRRLTGLPGASHLAVDAFDAETAMEMLVAIVGAGRVVAELRAAAQLVELCDRLPLAVRVVGAKLAAVPHRPLRGMLDRLRHDNRLLDELVHGDLDVRGSIATSYDALGERGKRLLRRLALVEATDFGGWAGAALLGVPPPVVEEALDDLAAAHLVEIVAGGPADPARYRLRRLVRAFARERASIEDPATVVRDVVRRALEWLTRAEVEHGRDFRDRVTLAQ
jgi:DNA-binding SARP family transcriptional activator